MSKYHIKCTNSCEQPPQPEPPPERVETDQSDLIALLNPNRLCNCEVAGRALSNDIPKYLGMQHIHNPPKPEKKDEPKKKPPCEKSLKIITPKRK